MKKKVFKSVVHGCCAYCPDFNSSWDRCMREDKAVDYVFVGGEFSWAPMIPEWCPLEDYEG